MIFIEIDILYVSIFPQSGSAKRELAHLPEVSRSNQSHYFGCFLRSSFLYMQPVLQTCALPVENQTKTETAVP